MKRLWVALLGALVLVFAGSRAEAADQCFQDNLGQVYVAKALTMPTANNCKTFNGYISGVASAVTGNVCKTKGNAFFFFNLHVNNGALDAYSVVFQLNASTLVGGNGRVLNPGYFGSLGTFTPFTIDKVACPPDRFFGF